MANTVFSEICYSGLKCPNCNRWESLEVLILVPDIPESYNQYCPSCQALFSDEHTMVLKFPWTEED